jgi:GTP-binding protein
MFQVSFVKSASKLAECPEPAYPEFALIGRSNVGKSTLINAFFGQKGLAKTSSRPGKTLLINHFVVNQKWFMVDLPGYGFAKVSKVQQQKLKSMNMEYLLNRPNLVCLGVLIDSRLEPQQIDLDFLVWLGQNEIPFFLVFTKADKLGYTKAQSAAAAYKKVLLKQWSTLPPVFVTSAERGQGIDEMRQYIAQLVDSYEGQSL